jgi:hypothetical protein
MGRPRKPKADQPVAADPAAAETQTPPVTPEPAPTAETPEATEATEEQKPAAPKVWTMEELVAEYFPNAKRFSGGAAAGLERELRRRNRLAERGY